MSFLETLEELLGYDDRKIEDFEVPEWNTSVKLRGMTGEDREKWEAHVNSGVDDKPVIVGMRSLMVGACLVNSEGERIVPKGEELEVLGSRSAAALERLFDKCMKMNGLTKEDEDKLVKNSETGQNES